MRSLIARGIAPFILLFVIVGCGGGPIVVPETPNERLIAAEVAYEGVITTVKDFIVQGVIVKGTPTADKVVQAIVVARAGLDAWGDAPANPNAMSVGLAGLKALQSILTGLKGTLR